MFLLLNEVSNNIKLTAKFEKRQIEVLFNTNVESKGTTKENHKENRQVQPSLHNTEERDKGTCY